MTRHSVFASYSVSRIRAFSIAVSSVCYSLEPDLRSTPSLATFKSRLKTTLFSAAYSTYHGSLPVSAFDSLTTLRTTVYRFVLNCSHLAKIMQRESTVCAKQTKHNRRTVILKGVMLTPTGVQAGYSSSFPGPLSHYTTKSVTHGQCDAKTYGYLPSQTALPLPFGRYSFSSTG